VERTPLEPACADVGAASIAIARSNSRMPESDPVAALVLDLLEWIGPEPRPYPEVIEAWRTSCPRLPVWEEANARGFIAHGRSDDSGAVVAVSPEGIAHLTARGRAWRRAR
jgi:D-3-phosphoglycerate dehydrogenase